MNDRSRHPIEFVLDPRVGLDQIFANVERVRTEQVDRTLVDTFDGRLAARGMTLDWSVSGALVLATDGRVVARSANGAPPFFARDLANGLHEQVEPVAKERALLPITRFRGRRDDAVVRNKDEKIVVRLALEDSLLRVEPVLGYERAFDDAVARLRHAARVVTAETHQVETPRLDPHLPAGEATALLCSHLADAVERNLPGALADLDTEFLHDLRVAVRRTRSLMREMLPPLDQAEKDFRWIQQITGPTRDLDVQLLGWPSDVVDLDPLRSLVSRKRRQAYETMCRQLQSGRFRDAWSAWRSIIAGPPLGDGRPIREAAGERIVSLYKKMVRTGSAIDGESPPEDLHKLRKRSKELRYLLELYGSIWPRRPVREAISIVKELQEVLGAFQDGAVEATYLRSLAPQLARGRGGPDALIALGIHLDHLAIRQVQARDQYAARFADFASKPHSRLMGTFG